ncbi:MAG: flagellar biosynthetic protein FliR [Bacteroidetes bacterium]|nr:flagellar biosynthetic protein FliR [Bacteroidota bacterium]
MFDANFLSLTQDKIIIGMLILTRISGLFVSALFFGHIAIPIPVKAMLILILTLIITPMFFDTAAPVKFEIVNMFLLMFKELLVGAILGFASNIIYWAARFGGGLVDMEMGFQAGAVFDPNSGAPTLVGEFYALTTLMLFLYFNGHHFLIEALYLSMKFVPLTTFELTEATLTTLFKITSSFLILGLKIAAPVSITIFNTNLALTLLSKVSPQINIFMLSFQVKVAAGLLVLFASIPVIGIVSKQALQLMQAEITTFLLTLNPNIAG